MCNMRNLDFHILNTLNRKFLEDHNPISHINSSGDPFIKEYMKLVAKYGPLWYEYQGDLPDVFQEVFSRTTFTSNIPVDIISKAAVQAKEFIVDCHYSGNQCNLTEDFVQFFDPYYFNCFTYTSYSWSKDSHNTASLSEGIENGWSSILFSGSGMLDRNEEIRVLPGLHESSSPVSASEGVRVVIHPPNTEPFPFTEGYDVPPGFSASFGVKPRKNIRIGPPHGNCSGSNPFDPDETQIYRSISCQKMCLQNHVIDQCGCMDLSLPKVPGRNAKSCRNMDFFSDNCMINATKECLQHLLDLYDRAQCTRKTRELVTSSGKLKENCECFPPCTEVLYDVSYSLSKWPATGYEGDAAYFDVFYIRNFTGRFVDTDKYETVKEYFNDTFREERMKDFARLNVYIADSNVIKTEESPDYNTNQLVSDIGGQLGLWVGISIITLTEVFQLFCDIFRFFLSSKVKNSKNVPSANNVTSNRDVTNTERPPCNGAYANLTPNSVDTSVDVDSAEDKLTSNHRNSPGRYVMTYSPRPPPLDPGKKGGDKIRTKPKFIIL